MAPSVSAASSSKTSHRASLMTTPPGVIGVYVESFADSLGITKMYPNVKEILTDFKSLPLIMQLVEIVLLFSPVLLFYLIAGPAPGDQKNVKRATKEAPPPAPVSKAPPLDDVKVGDVPTSREAARIVSTAGKVSAQSIMDLAATYESTPAEKEEAALKIQKIRRDAVATRNAREQKIKEVSAKKAKEAAKVASPLAKAEERKQKRKLARKQMMKTLRKMFCMR